MAALCVPAVWGGVGVIFRLGILLAVLAWYYCVRRGVLGFASREFGGIDEFTWWWSWLFAIPLTALTIGIPALIISFVAGAGPFAFAFR